MLVSTPLQIEIGLAVTDYPEILEPVDSSEPNEPKVGTIKASKASVRRWKKAIADFGKAQKEMSEALAKTGAAGQTLTKANPCANMSA